MANSPQLKTSKMKNNLSNSSQTVFEQIKETDENGNEFWTARKISKVLEYAEYRNFLPVIERAKQACKNWMFHL
jgi:DNA-damage-inducible protein D